MNGRYSLAIAIVVPGIWVFLSCLSQGQSERQWDAARERLVKLVSDGVQDPRVLESVGATKRHLFVPPSQRKNAYFDMALPIGSGATISPPHIVAFMTEQLNPQPTDRVLEIGTGSGYQAAILSPLVADVFSIEIIEEIGRSAAERLKSLAIRTSTPELATGFRAGRNMHRSTKSS